MKYQCQGLSYQLQPKTEADNTDKKYDNLRYHATTEFNSCFIIQFLTICKTEEPSI